MNFNFSKKGVVGSVIMNIVVTIAIVIILLLFIFGSSIVKKVDKVNGEISVMDESIVGLNEVWVYLISDFENHVQTRFFVEGGKSLSDAILEAEKDDYWKK